MQNYSVQYLSKREALMEKALSKEPFIKWQVFVKCYVLESMQKLQTSYEQNPDRNLLGLILKHPLHAIVTNEV